MRHPSVIIAALAVLVPATLLAGPYLDQPLPGNQPAIFAPGTVSTGLRTRDVALTPDGRTLYFCATAHGKSAVIVTREVAGRWTEPAVAEFSRDRRWNDLEPHVTPDGRRLLFVSNRPTRGEATAAGDANLWVCERAGDGWSPPVPLGPPVNTPAAEYFPSTSRDGTLYFTRRDTTSGHEAIWSAARLPDGGYAAPARLPEAVNAAPTQFNACVAPDGGTIIVCAAGREDNLGEVDYWVSFRDRHGAWRPAVNLGERFNGPGQEGWSPALSPDGAVFFFMSRRTATPPDAAPRTWQQMREAQTTPGNGLGQIWWVDAGFLDELRHAVLAE